MDISPEWKDRVLRWFPELQEGVSLTFTSEVDPHYNCLAWAVSCNTKYFEKNKGCFWPWSDVPDDTAEGWTKICEYHGFVQIPVENTDFVPGIEKIAIFVNDEGDLHAARQGENGWWKSKLGGWGPDIDHIDLQKIRVTYGDVVKVLQRVRLDWLQNARSKK